MNYIYTTVKMVIKLKVSCHFYMQYDVIVGNF